ncbi:hypothetical protein PR048_011921 [Dryococelus australis]|uniref:Uncharacterized protein n=1 Tax=Dryococelus australis TaxID=614101 RepID=A0ABQ9HMZ9_9NEOP|nr:hypothetical protein PR048_011921 [Dryococelus australis]
MAAYWLQRWQNKRWWLRDLNGRAGSLESNMVAVHLTPPVPNSSIDPSINPLVIQCHGNGYSSRSLSSTSNMADEMDTGRLGEAVSLLTSHHCDPGSMSAGSLRIFACGNFCWTVPLVGGFPRGSPVSPALSFRHCYILILITLIGSQDLDVKSRPNLFTHSLYTIVEKFCRQRGFLVIIQPMPNVVHIEEAESELVRNSLRTNVNSCLDTATTVTAAINEAECSSIQAEWAEQGSSVTENVV